MIYNDMSVLFFKHVAELFALFIGGTRDSFTALRLAARDSSALHYHNMNHYDEPPAGCGGCVSHDEREKDGESGGDTSGDEAGRKERTKGCCRDIFPTGN